MVSAHPISINLVNKTRFEALLDTRCYDQILASELPAEHKTVYLERFKLRSPHLTAPSRGYILHKMTILSQGIQFNIASGVEDGRTEHTWDATDGLTDERQVWQHTICNLSYQLLEPLISPMKEKVTLAERAVCQFRIAMTVLHEFTVRVHSRLGPITDNYSMVYGTNCSLTNISSFRTRWSRILKMNRCQNCK
jgi:hypothetical protein